MAISYPFPDPPEPGAAIEVAPGVLWILIPLPMALNHVNCYALDEGDSWTIVDTGLNSKTTREIWENLLAGPLGGKPVSRVIVTHHHPDHVGLAGWFQERGAELWMSRTAWLFARMLSLDEQPVPTPEALRFYREAGMDAEEYEHRRTSRPVNFKDALWPMPLGFRVVEEGATLHAAGRNWDVMFGQGHAPDHVTLWSEEGDILIAGDQVISSISPNLGVYPTEPLADPVTGWLTSCERIRARATANHLVLSGHKRVFSGLPERMDQLIANHHKALNRLVAGLGDGRTAAQCFDLMYRRQIGRGEYGLALAETIGHLNHLLLSGRARRHKEGEAWIWRAA
ncbi:MBL fold metallo-hydrolase [Paracoccaceae bacterium GXU_MW_L88]